MEIRGRIEQLIVVAAVLLLCLRPCAGFSSEAGQGTEPLVSDIARGVWDRGKSVKTFAARFLQTKNSVLLRDPLISSGDLYFEAGVGVLIQVTSPSPMKVLLKDRMMTISYPDLSETRQRFIGVNVADFFGTQESFEDLQERFSVRVVRETPRENAVLELIPKSSAMEKRIASIQVQINLQTSLPEVVSISERGGDETTIRLEFVSLNEPLPPQVFDLPIKEQRHQGH